MTCNLLRNVDRWLTTILAVWACTFLLAAAATAADLTAEKTEHGAVIKWGDRPFAEYLTRSGNKPVVWPVIGPTGKPMTRAYPLDESDPKEARDHIHQRSLWFTHGDVNGIDFWSQQPGSGSIVHREFVTVSGGSPAIVVTNNDWLRPDGQKMLEDTRTLKFMADEATRTIDFEVQLKATAGPVKFGDTKEGSFGVRVAHSISVDGKQGGQIVNSNGQTDKAAWGQPATWVDYHGPVDGQQVGIAMFDHPSNFAHPTRWHVRPYGLFAANPFGLHEFGAAETGGHTLNSGDTLVLRYRVLLHAGNENDARLNEAFAAFAASQR